MLGITLLREKRLLANIRGLTIFRQIPITQWFCVQFKGDIEMTAFVRLLCVFLAAFVCRCGVIQPALCDEESFSQAELQEAYGSLSPQDKRAYDKMSAEDRRRNLEILAKERRYRAGSTKPVSPGQNYVIISPGEKYEPDALLQKAYESYLDMTKPREEIIPLFEEYISKNPKSIFLPEIYFRIGTLYCTNIREELGDSYEPKLATEYYKKAHALYGDKFSYSHRTAWATITNYAWGTFEERKSYYDWLQKLSKTVTGDNIHPIRRISQTLLGFAPELTAEERGKIAEALKHKKSFALYIGGAETNILWRVGNNYRELVDLAESYPDTELGRQAEARLRKMDKFLLDGLDADSPVLRNVDDNASGTDTKNSAETLTKQVPIKDLSKQEAEVIPENATSPAATLNKWHLIIIVCAVIGLCAAACGLTAYKRMSGRNNV